MARQGALFDPPPPPDKPVDAMDADELAAAITYHNWRYFELSSPEISDYAFDALTRRLRALAPDHPALAALVGDATATGEKVFHDSPMLSLDKCYEEEELAKWLDGEDRRGYDGLFTETPKIDGVAASFKYDADGRLALAVTRGDGVRGEVFTANARHIEEVPKSISRNDGGEGPVEVRGELYLKLSTFRALAGDFSNPRNTTAGAIKQKAAERTGDYGLSFFAYDVLGVPDLRTEMDKLDWAREHGFWTVETHLLAADQLQAGYERWLARRPELDFEIDGVVYKFDDLDAQQRLGHTAHHPRFAIAYKFQGESGTSTLRDIEWSVSRTGAINPVAIIEPIELSGAMVSRASLHNLTWLKDKGVELGAKVVAVRRGGVIPHIEAVVEPGDGPPEIPTTCPASGHPTEIRRSEQKKGGEVVRVVETLYCSAPTECAAAVLGTLEHFVKAAEIDGFGPKVLLQLHDRGLVREPADFYTLDAADLLPLERVGEILATKLVGNVQARRQLPLDLFLRSLGIEALGASMARVLAQQFRTLDAVLALAPEDLIPLEGFQETLANAVVDGLAARADVIARLRERVTVEDYTPARPTAALSADGAAHPLAGKSVVFTGKLATRDRKSAQKLVRDHGGSTPSGVSGNLDYLVVGDEGSPLLGEGSKSSKQQKADRLIAEGAAVQIITETRFNELLGELS